MQPKNLQRVFAALAREGLHVERDGRVYRVRLKDVEGAPAGEVLLPDELPVEAKALRQLAGLAALRHPAGGGVTTVRASPDFHPGDAGVAIGSIVETEGIVVPAAVGTDINCGMRLHVVDLSAEQLLARRDVLVERLKGDYFFSSRDLPMTAEAMQGLFREGLVGWLSAVRRRPLGRWLGQTSISSSRRSIASTSAVRSTGTRAGPPKTSCRRKGWCATGGWRRSAAATTSSRSRWSRRSSTGRARGSGTSARGRWRS
ncbi:RtcB family protein [Nannocystis pusilla]|uniref:3'-phosphate/5'-hydroxy nucleic acid ligase n=1 Tax=Nannocystis pusilla TaxID=889268 RepID=A0A9X3EXF5_9BACT|nr:RtcB family protein [Nannocystis pusilla]MCY1011806.1 RtcB family protein [Nannocystis pusilla]